MASVHQVRSRPGPASTASLWALRQFRWPPRRVCCALLVASGPRSLEARSKPEVVSPALPGRLCGQFPGTAMLGAALMIDRSVS